MDLADAHTYNEPDFYMYGFEQEIGSPPLFYSRARTENSLVKSDFVRIAEDGHIETICGLLLDKNLKNLPEQDVYSDKPKKYIASPDFTYNVIECVIRHLSRPLSKEEKIIIIEKTNQWESKRLLRLAEVRRRLDAVFSLMFVDSDTTRIAYYYHNAHVLMLIDKANVIRQLLQKSQKETLDKHLIYL
jgi:hypothetical protein